MVTKGIGLLLQNLAVNARGFTARPLVSTERLEWYYLYEIRMNVMNGFGCLSCGTLERRS